MRLVEQHTGGVGYLLKERVSGVGVLADALARAHEGECESSPSSASASPLTITAACSRCPATCGHHPGSRRSEQGRQGGSAPVGGGQRVLRKRADGVVLIMTQGLGGVGDTAPWTGYSVSTPRYRLHRKVKSSPGLLAAPVGAMPPPSVTSCSNRSPLTVKGP